MGECIVVADFGRGRTKVGAYRKTNGRFELFSGAIFDTPEGGFSEPETIQNFSLALEKLSVKNGLLYVLFPTDEKNVIIGDADYPIGAPKEVEKIVKNNLSNFIPDEADQFYSDWRLVEAYPSGQGRFQIAAVRKNIMDTLHDMSERKHLKLRYADLNENAAENLACLLRRDGKYGLSSAGDAAAVVEVGHKTARIIVLTKDKIVQNETVNHNLFRLDKILSGNLGDLENDPSISPELLKFNPSYVNRVSQYQSFLSTLTTEVIRVIKQSISGDSRYRLTNVYFTGGMYKIPQLVSTVKDSFEVPCFAFPLDEFLQVNDNCISRGARKPYPTPDVFAASLGALMGGN